MSAPDQPPGFALAIRWRGRADIYPVGEDVRFVAVMRLPGCPAPYVLVARTEDQLERQLTAQTGGKGE